MGTIKYILGWIIVFSIVWFSSSFNGGCSKTETIYDTTTVYDTIIQNDTIHNFFWGMLRDSNQEGILFCDPVADPSQSELRIDWGGNSYILPEEMVWPGGLLFYGGEAFLDSLTDCTVSLTSNIGDCQGSVTMPGATVITNPNDMDTLPLGLDVNCTWIAAQNADFYWIWFDASGYDSLGYLGPCAGIDTFCTTNSLTIPASHFNVPGATYYLCWLDVEPMSGPLPGGGFNMTGDVGGILTAYGESDYIGFFVGNPTYGLNEHRYNERVYNQHDIIDVYLKALGMENTIR